MWHDMWNWNGGWGAFGLVHLLWWVFLVAIVVLVFRAAVGRRGPTAEGGDRSFEILRERFARGEIDQREYDERLRRLEESARPRR